MPVPESGEPQAEAPLLVATLADEPQLDVPMLAGYFTAFLRGALPPPLKIYAPTLTKSRGALAHLESLTIFFFSC